MKSKAILVSFIAIFAIVFALNTVMAFANIDDVIVNDVSIVDDDVVAAGFVSETVPVEVKFTADADVSDVRVKVYIEGYKDEISETTSRFRIVEGSSYIKRFSLELPSSFDLDSDPEDLTLLIRVYAKGYDSIEEEYLISMQKDSYDLNILSVDAPDTVTAGDVVPFDVVIQNSGNERLDNIYVRVSIPDLGITRKVFFGDMSPDKEKTYDDIVDSADKRIYLQIPADSVSGIYSVEIEAYNYDTEAIAKEKIAIKGIKADDTADDTDDTDDDSDNGTVVIDGKDDVDQRGNTVLVLTIILAIVFIVLLIILIVLLTKKPAEVEEFGETNYY